MTARDRAKLRDRIIRALAMSVPKVMGIDALTSMVAREVDRAVRAERAAFRATEELRAEQMRRKGKVR